MAVRGAKGGSDSARTPTEDKDSLRSTQIAEVVALISEGECQGLVNGLRSVYLDGVPVETTDGTPNFEDVSFDYRPGTPSQRAIEGLAAVQVDTAVALQIDHGSPIIRTISDPAYTGVRVTLSVSALAEQDQSTGDVHGSEFEFAIDVQSNGGGFVELARSIVRGKTMSRYTRSVRLALPGSAPWDIRVRRLSPDPTSNAVQNRFSWDAYTSIIDVKLRYPNSAHGRLRFNAQAFSRMPLLAFDWLGIRCKVPTNYNPVTRVYSGIWNGTFKVAWTNNPAWVMYELVTNARFGLGQYVPAALVNKWRLFSIGQYCDQQVPDGRGGQEPRFTCNLVLQTREEAYKVLQGLAGVFRGIVYWSGAAVDFSQDAPADAKPLFTPANVVDGAFSYSDVSERTKRSMCIVYWNDLAQMGRRVPEVVADEALMARYGLRELEMQPLGCTSRGMAARVGRWALYSEQLEGEVVSFAVGSDGVALEPGQVFKVADPNEAGERLGGRIRSATTSLIELDAPVVIRAGEIYTISVLQPDPAGVTSLRSEMRTVTTGAGTHQLLAVAPDFGAAPAAGTVYVIESTAVAATTWRALAIEEVAGRNQYRVTGVAHNPSKYDHIELGLTLDQRPISRVRTDVPPPTALTLTQVTYMDGAQPRIRVTVAWRPPAGVGALRYRLSWRQNLGSWTTRPDADDQSVDIDALTPGAFDVTVRAVNVLGRTSIAVAGSLQIGGKTSAPSTPTGVAVVAGAGGWIVSAAEPPDPDWTALEVRVGGANWDGAEVVAKARSTTALMRWLSAGTHAIRLRHWALDRPSAEAVAPLAIVAPTAPPVVSIATSVRNVDVRFGDCTTSQPLRHVLFRVGASGSTWETATDAGAAGGSQGSHTVTVPSDGQHRIWLRGVDVAGNVGAATSTLVTTTGQGNGDPTAPPAATAISATSAFGTNSVVWALPTYTVGGGHAESYVYGARRISAMPIFADAKALGSARGQATAFEHSPPPGQVWHYWVAHVTKAGVAGPPGGGTNGVAVMTARLASADMDAGLLDATKFANGIEPVSMVDAVPATKLTSVIFNTTEGRLYRWNGTAYARAIAASDIEGQLLGEQIADDAVTMRNVAARAITAAQLAITDLTNLVPNGSMAAGDMNGWQAAGTAWTVVPKASSGSNAAYINMPTAYAIALAPGATSTWAFAIPTTVTCEPGDQFYVCAWAAITGGPTFYVAGSFKYVVRWFYPDGSYANAPYAWPSLATAWAAREQVVTAPAGVIGFQMYFLVEAPNSGQILFSKVVCRRMAQGKLIVDGDLEGRHFRALSVSSRELAADAATFGKVAAGAIGTEQLRAKVVTTDKMVVVASQVIPNSDFQTNSLLNWRPWSLPANISIVAGGATAPTRYVCQFASTGAAGQTVGIFSHSLAQGDAGAAADGIEVAVGEEYFVTIDAGREAASAGTTFDVHVFYQARDGSFNTSQLVISNMLPLLSAGTWQRFSGYFTVPAGMTRAQLYVRWVNPTGGRVWWTNLRCNKAYGGELIVDGAIYGRHIVAGEVKSHHVDTRDLTVRDAAGAVILGAGTQLNGTWIENLTVGTLKLRNGSITASASSSYLGSGQQIGASVTTYTTRATLGVFTTMSGGEGRICVLIGSRFPSPDPLGDPRSTRSSALVLKRGFGLGLGTWRWRLLRRVGTTETMIWQRTESLELAGSSGDNHVLYDQVSVARDTPGPGVTAQYIYELYSTSVGATQHTHQVCPLDVVFLETSK